MESAIQCGGFIFTSDFDSGNLGHVEQIPKDEIVPSINSKTNLVETPDYEFNIWTRPDCFGTEFENGNRTWFFFGVQSTQSLATVKLNLVNLNRQGKMYSQGMAPVTRTIPGKPNWERIKDKPIYYSTDNIFTLSFKYRTFDAMATTYFAFTYPYTYVELQTSLDGIDGRMRLRGGQRVDDDIYYHRECVCYSLERRRVDLLTISSHHNITQQREDRLKNLFPDNVERPFKFLNKKVIFLSARVHPGETPSSFVLNGFLHLLLNRQDPVALALRKLYVFKLVPFLNPDGVARGHYRTDTRGVNLNRMYLSPSLEYHPTVYAARALIRYHHYGYEKEDDCLDSSEECLLPPACEGDALCQDSLSTDLHKGKMNCHGRRPGVCWPGAPPLTSASRVSRGHKATKLESEEDTTFSISSNNTTLMHQVEDLNLNEIQHACINQFSSLDDECAMDGLTATPTTTIPRNNNHLCDDDDDDVVTKGDSSKQSTCTLAASSFSSAFNINQQWCQLCQQAVKQLEDRMPGISGMLPHMLNTQDTLNAINAEIKKVLCVNCHSPISPCVLGSQNTFQHLNFTSVSNKTEPSQVSQSSTPKDTSDVNKNDSLAAEKEQLLGKKKHKVSRGGHKGKESGLFLYLDMHGHASKKGIFMYGNYFEDVERSVECMLLPRVMALNNLHFHFHSCNFTERNMYLRDRRDGMSREGSGRVAVLKATGLTRSYTLECNYNTGRLVNLLPPLPSHRDKDSSSSSSSNQTPPKYTPQLFEEVGKSLGASILDLTGPWPGSRIPSSEHRSISGIREWLRTHSKQGRPPQETQNLTDTETIISSAKVPSSARTSRPSGTRSARSVSSRPLKQPLFVDPERKENLAGYSDKPATSTSRPKTQRNMSLISIKKPAVPKVFKAPLRNRSLASKNKFTEDAEGNIKGGTRSLMESNRGNPKQIFKSRAKIEFKQSGKELPMLHKQSTESNLGASFRKIKKPMKESLFQKLPTAKPITKRLKMSQFIKYTDKEKYRIRKKGDVVKDASVEDVTWDGLCVGSAVAGGSGVSAVTANKRTARTPRRPSLRHLNTPNTDVNVRRHKFV